MSDLLCRECKWWRNPTQPQGKEGKRWGTCFRARPDGPGYGMRVAKAIETIEDFGCNQAQKARNPIPATNAVGENKEKLRKLLELLAKEADL